MATLTAADRADLNRAARLIAAVSIAGPAIAEILHPWILRFPAIGAAIAALEVLWSAYTKRPGPHPAASIPAPTPPPTDTYLS